jgi:lipoprotein-anchoring transpeptidase ErfK/SrfK
MSEPSLARATFLSRPASSKTAVLQFGTPRRLVGLFFALLLAVSWLAVLPAPKTAAAEVGPDRVYFSPTGHYLAFGFLDYWRGHGGISQFGYPLTEEITDPASGLTVQYFERAVFEWHADQPEGSRVMLQRLGADLTQGRTDPAFSKINAKSDDSCNFYTETSHRLCNGFLNYWSNHGGLSVFGFPISEEFTEKNPDTGKDYTVQYFERARFEWHPESQDVSAQVMLGRLGAQAAQKDGVNTSPIPQDKAVPEYSADLWYDPNASPSEVTAPPPGAPSDEAKWIEVDLSQQYLRAWEFNKKVFGEYISSGVAAHPTPTGTFHIFWKLRYDDMTGGKAGTSDYYNLPDVPWVMYFLEGGYALHGTYWHHNFGTPMSHGCVNMTIDGAAWVYNWAPYGTTVWIHD